MLLAVVMFCADNQDLAGSTEDFRLKELLGHSDLKSTERYLHWRADSDVADFDLLAYTLEGHRDA